MLTIPWKSTNNGGNETTRVQVSRLELARTRDVPGFLIAALRIRRVVLDTPGSVGLSLRADPLRRTFWTLSSWQSDEAIGAFMRSEAHRAVMKKYRNRMAGSHFYTWSHTHGARQPNWQEAMKQYGDSTRLGDAP